MKIVFLGMGAVGGLWASYFYKLGHEIVGICRGEHYRTIKESGLKFEDINGEITIITEDKNFHVYDSYRASSNILSQFKNGDWVIITSKAYSLISVITEYKKIIEQLGYVLVLQNGIGNEDVVKKQLPYISIYRGTTTNGAFLVSPGHIKHTGIGFTKIGFPNLNFQYKSVDNVCSIDRIRPILDIFKATGFDTEYVNDIDVVLWEKVFINVAINAPGSLFGIRNGELLETQERRKLMENAILEAWNVGMAMNISLNKNPKYYTDLAFDVAKKTSNNKNSMLQDLLKGRKTEIEYINGQIAKYGKQYKIDVPINQYLTNEIRRLENTNEMKME